MMMNMLLAMGGARVDLSFLDGQNFTEIDAPAVAGSASATLWLNSVGTSDYAGSISTGGLPVGIGNWLVGGVGAGYEVRTTVTGDAPTSGSATGSWVSLGSNQLWTWQQIGNGIRSAACVTEIRRTSDGAVVASAVWTVYVEVTIA